MKIIKSLIVLFAVTVSMVACKNEAATEAAEATEAVTTEAAAVVDTAAAAVETAVDTAMAK